MALGTREISPPNLRAKHIYIYILTAAVVIVLAIQREIALHKQIQHEAFPQRPSHQVVTQTELITQGLGYGKLLWDCFLLSGILEDRHL